MKELKKGDVITIVARRWFEKVNGNTYHSCEVYVNGDLIERIPFEYGYGSHYLQTARQILKKAYSLPIEEAAALWRLKDHDIKIIESVTDVQRKRDL